MAYIYLCYNPQIILLTVVNFNNILVTVTNCYDIVYVDNCIRSAPETEINNIYNLFNDYHNQLKFTIETEKYDKVIL